MRVGMVSASGPNLPASRAFQDREAPHCAALHWSRRSHLRHVGSVVTLVCLSNGNNTSRKANGETLRLAASLAIHESAAVERL